MNYGRTGTDSGLLSGRAVTESTSISSSYTVTGKLGGGARS